MGCGKGGDLSKWVKAKIRELVGAGESAVCLKFPSANSISIIDIADVSIDQARQRWESMRQPKFMASFHAIDCYNESISKVISPNEALFDVVSMQFCMHYAFESEKKARCMLDNVSRYLRTGGVFIGTIPNAELL
jgi:mRNA (guanine-N7-)-methyltransferase